MNHRGFAVVMLTVMIPTLAIATMSVPAAAVWAGVTSLAWSAVLLVAHKNAPAPKRSL
jgi:hypothetical protein